MSARGYDTFMSEGHIAWCASDSVFGADFCARGLRERGPNKVRTAEDLTFLVPSAVLTGFGPGTHLVRPSRTFWCERSEHGRTKFGVSRVSRVSWLRVSLRSTLTCVGRPWFFVSRVSLRSTLTSFGPSGLQTGVLRDHDPQHWVVSQRTYPYDTRQRRRDERPIDDAP
jgi:hypothetical protein